MIPRKMMVVFGLLGALSLWAIASCKQAPAGPLDDLPALESLVADPARKPSAPAVRPDNVGLRWLLVAFAGVHEPKVRTAWTPAQAEQRILRLLAMARAKGADFGELAKQYSDDTGTSGSGGDRGVLMPGQLHPDLELAAFALKIGQVSDPILTPQGYCLLQRTQATDAQASELLVAYTGAKRPARVERTRDQARALAEQILERIRAGASFEEEALAHSDHPSHLNGGFLPIFRKGLAGLGKEKFEEIVWNLAIGGVSEIIETPTGFHIVKRWPVRRIRGRVARVGFIDPTAPGVAESNLPDREQARVEAERIRAEALAGSDFSVLATRNALGAGASRDGRVDWFGRGEVPLALERAVFSLQPGQVSEVIEAEFAFFIFKRVP